MRASANEEPRFAESPRQRSNLTEPCLALSKAFILYGSAPLPCGVIQNSKIPGSSGTPNWSSCIKMKLRGKELGKRRRTRNDRAFITSEQFQNPKRTSKTNTSMQQRFIYIFLVLPMAHWTTSSTYVDVVVGETKASARCSRPTLRTG